MDIPSKYNAAEVEDKWYKYWMENNFFHSEPDEREPYTIVIPPPNVTGVLHMGHMLNNTIQDILTRRARMLGKNACWVPGTDHASIATEARVVNKLKKFWCRWVIHRASSSVPIRRTIPSRSIARARNKRAFTVPNGDPVIVTISS